MNALKEAGLAGVSLDEGKTKDPPALSHGDRLAQNTAKLKQQADQQHKRRKQSDELEEVIRGLQADLASLHSALAMLEKDYAETATMRPGKGQARHGRDRDCPAIIHSGPRGPLQDSTTART